MHGHRRVRCGRFDRRLLPGHLARAAGRILQLTQPPLVRCFRCRRTGRCRGRSEFRPGAGLGRGGRGKRCGLQSGTGGRLVRRCLVDGRQHDVAGLFPGRGWGRRNGRRRHNGCWCNRLWSGIGDWNSPRPTALGQSAHIGMHGVRPLRILHLGHRTISHRNRLAGRASATGFVQQTLVNAANLGPVCPLTGHRFLANQGVAPEIGASQRREAMTIAVVQILRVNRVVHPGRIIDLASKQDAAPTRGALAAVMNARLVEVYGLVLAGDHALPVGRASGKRPPYGERRCDRNCDPRARDAEHGHDLPFILIVRDRRAWRQRRNVETWWAQACTKRRFELY